MTGSILTLWPLLASMAVLIGVRWRTARRRTALNRAMHELRRPLQALVLSPGRRAPEPSPGPLELALAALDDLDLAINGIRPTSARRPVAARPLVEGVVARWRPLAVRRDGEIDLEWAAGQAIVLADPVRVAQAVDNLLANAVEHGDGRVQVKARRGPVGLTIRVAAARGPHIARHPDPRRGHGMAVVERVAVAHLGRFRVETRADTVIAILELPLAPTPLPAVPIEWASGAGGRARSSRRAKAPAPSAA